MARKTSDRRDCPWCGESIKLIAVICHYCRQDVTQDGEERAGQLRSRTRVAQSDDAKAEGQPASAPQDEALRGLSQVVPSSLLDNVAEAAEEIDEGERRPVTVAFADLCGFASMTEEIGAEGMFHLLDEIYAGTRRIIEYYGGTVDKFMGDAVMALFGVPHAHGDDPERAIRAMVDVRTLVRDFGAARGYTLDTHSGVAHGEIVFRMGAHRLDFRTIGDAVNLASRLQSLAANGEVLVDHRTYVQTRPIFHWGRHDEVEIRGKKHPARVHTVAGVQKAFGKAVLGERIDLSPLVGRKRELALLVDLALRPQRTLRTATIRGEAGLGKSRLIYELHRALPGAEMNWITGRCLSYGANMPYLPFIGLFRSFVKGRPGPEGAISEQELETAVSRIYEKSLRKTRSAATRESIRLEQEQTVHGLAAMLSVKIAHNPALDMSAAQRREYLLLSARRTIERLADCKPTILIFEDVQWADEDSLELLDALMRCIHNKPLTIVIAARPELIHAFPHSDAHVEIGLSELSARDSEALLTHLLGSARLPRKLLMKIKDKTEGNPFYIEEVVLNLEEGGFLERTAKGYRLLRPIDEIQIPDTVEGVALARLDRLEKGIRSVLQCASVIGPEFRYRVLEHLVDFSKQLGRFLGTLAEKEYILERSEIPELEYIFRHVVLRDVTYGTLLEKRRRVFHGRVGAAMESLFHDRLEEFLEIVAHHYEQGQITGKAIEFLERSANKAEALFANRAAASHWERLLAVVEGPGLPAAEKDSMRLRAGLRLGEMCRRIGEIHRGIEAFRQCLKAAERLGDAAGAAKALQGISEVQRLAGDFSQGIDSIKEALKRAKKVDDDDLLASCHNLLGYFEYIRGNTAQARKNYDRVLAYSEGRQNRMRRYQALNHLGILLFREGKFEQALGMLEEALALASELGRRNEQASIEINLGIQFLRAGDSGRALERTARALDLSEKYEFEYGAQLALLALSDIHLKMGDFKAADSVCGRLLKRNDVSTFADVRAGGLSNRARASVAHGRLERAERDLEEAARLGQNGAAADIAFDAVSVRAEAALAAGDRQGFASHALEAWKIARKMGDLHQTIQANILRSRASLEMSRHAEAGEFARTALRLARQQGIPREAGYANLCLALFQKAIGKEDGYKKSVEEAGRIAREVKDAALERFVKEASKS